MAGIDTVNFPNSRMGAAIAAGTSRFRVYGTDTTRFPNSRMGNAVALGVSQFLSLQVTGPAVIPASLTPPLVSGTPQAGQSLTTTSGTWSGTAAIKTYQWKRAGANIGGATGSSYLLVAADIGSTITVTVTATNTAGSASATSSATAVVTALPPSSITPPLISGGLTVGNVLTTTDGTWNGIPAPTLVYQWKRDATSVGTSSNSYTLVTADIGATMTVTVTATNSGGSANATSGGVGPVVAVGVAPANITPPSITGTLMVAQTLTATGDTWTGTPTPTISYQWKRGATNVGTGSNSYTLVSGDVGATMTVVATGTNTAGNASATSSGVGPVINNVPINTVLPTISGTPTEGQVLSANANTWTGAATIIYTYQWRRGGSNISGATANNYVLLTTDVGALIDVQVKGTNSAGNATATAASVGPIAALVAGSTWATWDPTAGVAHSVTLSNGNLTATNTGTTNDQGARVASSLAQTTGKYYFEITVTTNQGSSRTGPGIAPPSATYIDMFNLGVNSITWFQNTGSVFSNTGNVGSVYSSVVASGQIFGMAVDLDNRRIWFCHPPVDGTGSSWNDSTGGNPVTTTGGYSIPSGSVAPIVFMNATAGTAFTANFGASAFAIAAVPSGFMAGWPGGSATNVLTAGVGLFSFTGESMITVVDMSLSAGVGTVALNGQSANLSYSGTVVFSMTPQTAPAAVTTAGTTHNFGSCNIGTAGATRYIAILTGQRASAGTQAVSSISISGYAGGMTKVIDKQQSASSSEIWITSSPVTTGTTATISVTYAASNDRSTIQVYAIVSPGTVVPTGSAVGTAFGGLGLNAIIVIPSGGFAIGGAYSTTGGPGTPTATPAGFNNLDINANPITTQQSFAFHSNAGVLSGSTTLTMTLASGNSSAVYAAWGP